MQHDSTLGRAAPDAWTLVTETAPMKAEWHGRRAKCLQRLMRLDLPVPTTVALPFATVRAIARGEMPDLSAVLAPFGDAPLLTVRPSSQDPDWGGPGAITDIGMNDARRAALATRIGPEAAAARQRAFVETYAREVARLDPDALDVPAGMGASEALATALAAFEGEVEAPFPQDPAEQLAGVLRSMARVWEGTSARLLRHARGAPEEAGLGLVVQEMAGGGGESGGFGVVQFVSSETGRPQVTGRFAARRLGRAALTGDAMFLKKDARGPSLEEEAPEALEALRSMGAICRRKLREEMQIEFTLSGGALAVLDAVPVPRTSRAAVRIAVALAEDSVIPREEALMRIPPAAVTELLHPRIDPAARPAPLVTGIAASPGAATGRLAFSGAAAQAMRARGEAPVLVGRETTPEDIRGLSAAAAVVTERGGMSSHAAVIARGLGIPCVVGVTKMKVDAKALRVRIGARVLKEGDEVTVDGTDGALIEGPAPMLPPAPGEGAETLLAWADEVRDIGVRANADTGADARQARRFGAEGIGLCRTEHMVLEEERLTLLREIILAEDESERSAAVDRLLPLHRRDIGEVLREMRGAPVTLRLFDPPLHEFMPATRDGLHDLAEALGRPFSHVRRRAAELAEFNPMLGMRGVRLGIALPELYDMQAQAILLAAHDVTEQGLSVEPEIMIPLVSTQREVDIVTAAIAAAAERVRGITGRRVPYTVGVMVETPRAALRAGPIAARSDFLSFGTNDLTQMTYGLSRDDAGRFMDSYVRQGVWPEDPFLRLDTDGVGELLLIAAERARAVRPDVSLAICGEHGGDADSIAFCRRAGFAYVSCSPFRVPVARLAAARLAIADRLGVT